MWEINTYHPALERVLYAKRWLGIMNQAELSLALVTPLRWNLAEGGWRTSKASLMQLARHLKTQAGRGCFMVNTMAATPNSVSKGSDFAKTYIASFLKAVRATLERAAAHGEIAPEAVTSAAEMLLGVVLGANLLARANQPQPLIEAVLDAAVLHINASPARRPSGTAATAPVP